MLKLRSSSRLAVRPVKESSRQYDCPPHSSLFNRRCEWGQTQALEIKEKIEKSIKISEDFNVLLSVINITGKNRNDIKF